MKRKPIRQDLKTCSVNLSRAWRRSSGLSRWRSRRELMEAVHDAADALLTMRGHPERQRGHLAGLPFTVRLVLCMWLTDTELAAKLIRVAYSKA